MKKYIYLLYSTLIGVTFFGIMFTIIRTFYYGAKPSFQEYVFPASLGTTFGIGIGLWRIQTKEYKEKLEKTMAEIIISNEQIKKKNEKLIESNNELVETKDKLFKSQKMEYMGLLAGSVAHDLNNVLFGVVSYPEMLLSTIEPDSPLRKPLSRILKSGEKAVTIVQDLLSLARRGIVSTEVSSLNQVIGEYIGSPEHEKLMDFHPRVQIETHLETNSLNILISPTHLSKTIMNLVSNAAEAQPDGGRIVITTKIQYVDRKIKCYSDTLNEGNYAVLIVSDYGTGISPEDMENIFDPFYTKKKMGRSGTGLGMTVVWWTVTDHKGYIDVQSIEGRGTTFTLYFPITIKEIEKENEPPLIEDYSGNGESILIIDDREDQREIVLDILTELGYNTTTVPSGEQAVENMKTNSYDLLILDMIMEPGIDGLETYNQVLELHPKQKAIIVSGFSETDRVKKLKDLGATKYLKKPYTIKEFGLAVKEELQN